MYIAGTVQKASLPGLRGGTKRTVPCIFFILAVALAIISAGAEAKVVDEHIYIVPAGDVAMKELEAIKESLPEGLPMSVGIDIMPAKDIPGALYDPSRKQYDAEAVLNNIARDMHLDVRVDVVLIITNADLYLPGQDFVFGAADKRRSVCIMSLARLRNEFYGLKGDGWLLLKRAHKEALRELGYAWGLEPCSDPKCAGYMFKTVGDVDRAKVSFCHNCRTKLRSVFLGVPIAKKAFKG